MVEVWKFILPAILTVITTNSQAQALPPSGVVNVHCEGRSRWGSGAGSINGEARLSLDLRFNQNNNTAVILGGSVPSPYEKPIFMIGKVYRTQQNDYMGATSFKAEELGPGVVNNNATGGIFLLYPNGSFGLTEIFENGASLLGFRMTSGLFLDGTCQSRAAKVPPRKKR